MSRPFVASALEERYAFLEQCPNAVLQEVVTFPSATLQQRVVGARRWREALLAGRLPPEDGWPPPEIAAPARRALTELNLVRFFKEQPELVDACLKDLFTAFTRRSQALHQEVEVRLRELEQLERVQLTEAEARAARRQGRAPQRVSLDEEALERLRREAERQAAEQPTGVDEMLVDTWGERARLWAEIASVFGDLGAMMGRGWDLSLGVLRHTGWLEVLRLKELVEKLPQLRAIIQALGRLHDSTKEESVAERILVSVRRLEEERREVRTPWVPAETRGVERSDSIARMLPVEAALLGHPTLRLLWHARRAERVLLTYRVEGVEIERSLTEQEVQIEQERRRPRPERGPIIAVMDTSGSMHGLPEQVAKALVLETLRVARAERRRCLLYAYSGPGQVLEHELDLSLEGIGRLLTFLGMSFGGGNDETGVMIQVVKRLEEEGWKKADVIVASDGEWPVPAQLVGLVRRAKEEGTRFHGVQIGNRGRTGLHAICDPVHVFQDWAALSGRTRRG